MYTKKSEIHRNAARGEHVDFTCTEKPRNMSELVRAAYLHHMDIIAFFARRYLGKSSCSGFVTARVLFSVSTIRQKRSS